LTFTTLFHQCENAQVEHVSKHRGKPLQVQLASSNHHFMAAQEEGGASACRNTTTASIAVTAATLEPATTNTLALGTDSQEKRQAR